MSKQLFWQITQAICWQKEKAPAVIEMDYENFVRHHCRLTDLPSTQILNFLMYEMPLKYVTSIQVNRTVDTEMDFENFVQYQRCLTDLH